MNTGYTPEFALVGSPPKLQLLCNSLLPLKTLATAFGRVFAFFRPQVSLSADLSCGTVVRTLKNDLFDQPSTAVRKGNSLYAVMFKIDTPAEDVPTTTYEVVRVDRDGDAQGVCHAAS